MLKNTMIGCIAAVVFTGCTSTSTITEYSSDGKVAKVMETKEDVSKVITSSLKDKSVLIVSTGWAARIVAVPADIETGGAANVEMSIGTRNIGYSSIPVNAEASADIGRSHADAIRNVLNTNLSMTSSGVSGTTGAGTSTRASSASGVSGTTGTQTETPQTGTK